MVRKAYSHNLEVEVEIEQEDLADIRYNSFKEIFLDFKDEQIRKKIPMFIGYLENQKESIKFFGEPDNTYFGQCEKVHFILNDESFSQLIEYSHFTDRFFELGAGKLEIKVTPISP